MAQLKKPILMIACILICFAMVRLGFWQIDRAEQKNVIHQQRIWQSEQLPQNLIDVLNVNEGSNDVSSEKLLRFQPVRLIGHYLPEASVFIDNQVFNGNVGYHLLTPFQIKGLEQIILVNRGWLSAGASRDVLPSIETPVKQLQLLGRLNKPHAKPPIWDDKYPVSSGQVWQFLALNDYAKKMQLNPLPLMLELAPETDGVGGYQRTWQSIGDGGVGKHKAYALQWFAMAVALFVAGLTVLILSLRTPDQ